MKKPIKNLINKNDLIKRIVKSENIINSKSKFNNKITQNLVSIIYDEIENQLMNILSDLDETNTEDNSVTVKLFDGISFTSYVKPPINYIPHFMKNKPESIDDMKFERKVEIKANVTRYCKEKATEKFEMNNAK